MNIRPFRPSDSSHLVEILTLNNQFDFPNIEGPEAMERFAENSSSIFLIAEVDGVAQGLIRSTYDGSRALIHLLSVHPQAQSSGIGSALLAAAESELDARGAPGAAVTVSDESSGFWDKKGYGKLPVHVRLKPAW